MDDVLWWFVLTSTARVNEAAEPNKAEPCSYKGLSILFDHSGRPLLYTVESREHDLKSRLQHRRRCSVRWAS